MTIDIFNRVQTHLSINVPPVEQLSVNNVCMATTKTLPGSVPYKLYQDVTDFIADFPDSTAPEEFTWGTTFYAGNPNGNLFVVTCVLPTSDTSITVSTAVLAALEAIQANAEIGQPDSFYTVSISNGDEIFYSDAQVLAEIENFAASGQPLAFIGQTYSNTLFTSVSSWIPAAYLQSTALATLAVMVIGYPNLASQPVVPKASAGVAAFYSQISLTAGATTDPMGQTLPNVTPLTVGATDTYGDVFTRAKINTLVSEQVNMYVRFKNQTQFAQGFAMAPVIIPMTYYYIRQFLEESLQNAINPLFYSGNLPYSNATIAAIHALISDVLNDFVNADLLQQGFTIVDPVLDYTQPIPRSLSWTISGELQGVVYAINIGGNLQG